MIRITLLVFIITTIIIIVIISITFITTSSRTVKIIFNIITVIITTTVVVATTVIEACTYVDWSIKLILGAMVRLIQWVIARRECVNVTMDKRINVAVLAVLIALQITITRTIFTGSTAIIKIR